ncbi:MAG TPA: diguanylate cyclase, partial [Wenzhouxiangella sp.]|nr:diguanylate cyclase [Wenzhouxiangella sp.]
LPDSSDPHALAANRVQRLMIDSQDRLWVGTTAGVNFIDPEQPDIIRRFAHDQPDHPLYDERIWGMVEHASGYWFATSSGLYRLSPDLTTWTHLLPDQDAAQRFERGAEVRTVALAHGQIWAGSQLGVFRWNPNSDELIPVAFEDAPDRPTPRINTILESKQGGLWVGAHDGLYQIDEVERRYVFLDDDYRLLPDVDIRALYENNEGNLWIGSRDRGIIQGRRVDQVFKPLAEETPDVLMDDASRLASAVLTDRSNRLWIGVPGGLLRRDDQGQWTSWEFPTESNVRRVDALTEDPSGTVWVASDGGLFKVAAGGELEEDARIFDKLDIAKVPVNAILEGPDGTLWVGLWSFGIVRWDPQANQVIDIGLETLRDIRADLVYQITRDPQGAFWASTRYSGIFKFEGEHWERVPLEYNEQEYAPTIYCVHHQPIEVLWLCTEDGLVRYPIKAGAPHTYDTTQGLPTNRITGLITAPNSDLWVLTTRGVARKLSEENRFVSYGLADGLPGLAMQRNSIGVLSDGRVVMGTSEGAVIVESSSAGRGLRAPSTVLSRLWLDGQDLTRSVNPAALSLELPYQHRELTFQFAVLDFHEPERNLIRHRLRGYESSFSELSSDRTARFMNLPPGEYTLEVEGWSSRGMPGAEPLEIPIHVAAPWWHSPLAWVVALILLGAMVWMTIQLRLQALNVSNKRLQSLVAERTEELATANERLRASSERDFLTRLFNRRGFTQRFAQLRELALRSNRNLSVIIFDLDFFKQINDSFGHDSGDEILQGIGKILHDHLRSPDLAARWGGEEFLLALPDTDAEGARKVCEKIRQSLAGISLAATASEDLKVTATFGVVARQGCDWPLEKWVKAADEALYAGKNSGRDQIRIQETNDL